ncbi:asparagine synthase C-terminal domain-containing protein [Halalkalirubrum salinum]|uniref:asparagine synthase C-terminal domain-containing protein n=1 Tax=Halalkalirubrum salinum TaxID=2563889 RepID=UPI0010FB6AA6|nr:asparagine synthase-related protein [Halalkalirubrum salinum]
MLRGATEQTVVTSIDHADPLPGTAGFGGRLEHTEYGPTIVRDVLGRQPLFYEAADGVESPESTSIAFDQTELSDPVSFPAGSIATAENGVEQLWSLPEPEVRSERAGIDGLAVAIEETLGSIDPERVAVAFSGGVDSALVASGFEAAPCYVAGFPGSHDIEAAREAASLMDRELRVVSLSHDDLIEAVPRLARAIGRTNPMDIAIALPLFLVAEAAADDGYDRLALGQGADELFGGYAKHVEPADDHRVEATTVRGAVREILGTLPNQLERDVLALGAAGVEPVTPYLHDRVVAAALRLPASLLATPTARKVALRRIAAGTLPDRIATADKKAVQYGTYVSRELDRLARQNGFKRRMDDHVGQYIRSLCG